MAAATTTWTTMATEPDSPATCYFLAAPMSVSVLMPKRWQAAWVDQLADTPKPGCPTTMSAAPAKIWAQLLALHPLGADVDAGHRVALVAERLVAGGLDGVGLRAREDRVELHEIAPAVAALGLGADQQAAVEQDQRPVAQHPGDQTLGLRPVDPAEVRHALELLPGVLEGDAVAGERHGEELMNEDGPAATLRGDVLDPPLSRELDERGRLQHALGGLTEEGRIGGLAGAAACATHSLQERADGVGRLGLEDAIEVADVDAEL